MEQNKQRVKDFLYNCGKGKSIYEIMAVEDDLDLSNDELEIIETESKENMI